MLNRSGAERELLAEPAPWVELSISPGGERVALSRWDGARRTLWTMSLANGALTPVTYDGDTFRPTWLPGGGELFFTHFPQTGGTITSMWRVAIDGRADIHPIGAQTDAYPSSIAANGRALYYGYFDGPELRENLGRLDLGDPGRAPVRLLATRANEFLPLVSPDGRWLAYATDASGRPEVRIGAAADPAVAVQLSVSGGRPVSWSRDGTRLFYLDGGAIWEVTVGAAGPAPGTRRRAFVMPDDVRDVEVMPDGEHAILIRGGSMYSDLVVAQGALVPR